MTRCCNTVHTFQFARVLFVMIVSDHLVFRRPLSHPASPASVLPPQVLQRPCQTHFINLLQTFVFIFPSPPSPVSLCGRVSCLLRAVRAVCLCDAIWSGCHLVRVPARSCAARYRAFTFPRGVCRFAGAFRADILPTRCCRSPPRRFPPRIFLTRCVACCAVLFELQPSVLLTPCFAPLLV